MSAGNAAGLALVGFVLLCLIVAWLIRVNRRFANARDGFQDYQPDPESEFNGESYGDPYRKGGQR